MKILLSSCLLSAFAMIGCLDPRDTTSGDMPEGTSTSVSALSSIGGSISQSEILARAQYWFDQRYIYSPNAPSSYTFSSDASGKSYRNDCSGLVSEAWHLTTSYTTVDFNVDNSLWSTISWDSMRSGDAYVRNDSTEQHIELFAFWDDPNDHSQGFEKYSFNTNNYTVENPYELNNFGKSGHRSYDPNGFHAIRYASTVADPSSGTVWDRGRTASGTWAASATEVDTNAQITDVASAALPDGSMQLFTLVPGSGVWERTRSAGGTWASNATHVDTNGSITAVAAATDAVGTVHLFMLIPGSGVWDRTYTGSWGASSKVDANGSITAVAAAMSGSTLHFFMLIPGSGLWDRTFAGGVWASSNHMDLNGNAIDVSAAGLPDGTLHVQLIVPGSGIWDRKYSAGTWDSSAMRIDTNGSLVGLTAAGLTDGTIHLDVIAS